MQKMAPTTKAKPQRKLDAVHREEATLRIAALSRLSGIPSPTLRAWERRYAAFKPVKTGSGQRLYARSDASRAVLMRQLADQGFSLQQLAGCALNELLRLRDTSRDTITDGAAPTIALRGKRNKPNRVQADQAGKVLIVGESLALRLLQEKNQAKLQSLGLALEVGKQLPKPKSVKTASMSLLLIEIVSLLEHTCQSVLALKASITPKPLIVCYRFGAAHLIGLLRHSGITVLREPIDDDDLIAAMSKTRQAIHFQPEDIPPPSPPRYSIAKIREIAQNMPATACECPRHVSEILEQLLAFEDYSQHCLNNGVKDLALHAELLRITAISRARFEDALEAVARHEGLVL
jgi:DNA-binding transcriptional MerR regulator